MSLDGHQQVVQGQQRQIEQQQGVFHLADTKFTWLAAEMADMKEGLPTFATSIVRQITLQVSVEVEQAQYQQEQRFNSKW